jgi:hypothetical protein
MERFKNKASVIIDLQSRGYDRDFIIKDEYLVCIQTMQRICPDDFEVMETYRFDGRDRACDNYVIYAVRSVDNEQKGILMASYCAFSKGLSVHLWSKLSVNFNF